MAFPGGRMDKTDDVDWVRVEADAGSTVRLTGWGRRLGSPVDLVIAAHRDTAKRERIASNDDADGPDSTVQLTVPEEGSFLMRVNDFQRRGGERGFGGGARKLQRQHQREPSHLPVSAAGGRLWHQPHGGGDPE